MGEYIVGLKALSATLASAAKALPQGGVLDLTASSSKARA